MCKVCLLAAVILSIGSVVVADEAISRRTVEVATYYDLSSLRGIVSKVSREHNLDPKLIDAVVRVESDYNVRALSHKGAMGLMQLMPATARRLSVLDPFDPEQNIRGGVREFSRLVDRYAGNLALALAAYNAGEGAVQKYRGIPPYNETRNYVRKIMSIYTGKPYSLGKTSYRKKAVVRLSTDPSTGQTVITNQSASQTRKSLALAKGNPLGGGFGK